MLTPISHADFYTATIVGCFTVLIGFSSLLLPFLWHVCIRGHHRFLVAERSCFGSCDLLLGVWGVRRSDLIAPQPQFLLKSSALRSLGAISLTPGNLVAPLARSGQDLFIFARRHVAKATNDCALAEQWGEHLRFDRFGGPGGVECRP